MTDVHDSVVQRMTYYCSGTNCTIHEWVLTVIGVIFSSITSLNQTPKNSLFYEYISTIKDPAWTDITQEDVKKKITQICFAGSLNDAWDSANCTVGKYNCCRNPR